MGDYNVRIQDIGDKEDNTHGKILQEHIINHKQQILNETLAYGMPTCQNYMNGGHSIPDMTLIPSSQQMLWDKLYITSTERHGHTAHHSVIAQSLFHINIKPQPVKIHYTINYNEYDAYRQRKYIQKVLTPVHEEYIQTIETCLDTDRPDPNATHPDLEILQYIETAMHHLTALQIYGIRRVQNGGTNYHEHWYHDAEIQDILNLNADESIESKMQQIQTIMKSKEKSHKYKLRLKQTSQDLINTYKTYSCKQKRQNAPYPEHVKTTDGKEHPIEIGLSKYLSNRLLTKIKGPTPTITNREQPITRETFPVVTEKTIERVIHDLQKNKAPGLTAMPIRYYHWGHKPKYSI